MIKMKVITITIVSILLGAGITSVGIAQSLDGKIDVEVSKFLGLVKPVINLENESDVSFVVRPVGDENSTYYQVNDTIEINLDITDNSGRGDTLPFVFGRSIFCSAIIWRMPKITLQGGFFKRLIPTFVPLQIVNVVNSTIGKNKSTVIEFPLNYTIAEEVANSEGEQMTMHILCMGMIPDDVNGIGDIKFISHKKVTINVGYYHLEQPPE